MLLASGLCAGFIHAADSQASPRLNIITIVGDDIGWGDVGFHGSSIKTPNIARLNGRIHSLITKDGSVVKKLLPQLQAYLPRPAGA